MVWYGMVWYGMSRSRSRRVLMKHGKFGKQKQKQKQEQAPYDFKKEFHV